MIILRENARHVSSAARQLEPFAVCLAAVSSIIDRRRCHPPDPAPMESLCLQINTIEPDSQHRIEAIEKVFVGSFLMQQRREGGGGGCESKSILIRFPSLFKGLLKSSFVVILTVLFLTDRKHFAGGIYFNSFYRIA